MLFYEASNASDLQVLRRSDWLFRGSVIHMGHLHGGGQSHDESLNNTLIGSENNIIDLQIACNELQPLPRRWLVLLRQSGKAR